MVKQRGCNSFFKAHHSVFDPFLRRVIGLLRLHGAVICMLIDGGDKADRVFNIVKNYKQRRADEDTVRNSEIIRI